MNVRLSSVSPAAIQKMGEMYRDGHGVLASTR